VRIIVSYKIENMPNRNEHKKTGGLVGGGVACLSNLAAQTMRQQQGQQQTINVGELLITSAIGYAIGSVGGILPDVLEPAYHPGHRSTCHSLAAGVAIAIGLSKLNKSSKLSGNVKSVATVAGAGYLSHLLLDSQTAARLPVW